VEGVSCTAREILTVLAVMRKSQELRKNFDRDAFPQLASLAGSLPDFRSLLQRSMAKSSRTASSILPPVLSLAACAAPLSACGMTFSKRLSA